MSEELAAAGDEATENTVAKLAEVQGLMEEAGVAFNEVDLTHRSRKRRPVSMTRSV